MLFTYMCNNAGDSIRLRRVYLQIRDVVFQEHPTRQVLGCVLAEIKKLSDDQEIGGIVDAVEKAYISHSVSLDQ